jgi:hypothetical protein
MSQDPFSLRERARQYRRQAESATDIATVRRLLQMADDLAEDARQLEERRRSSG